MFLSSHRVRLLTIIAAVTALISVSAFAVPPTEAGRAAAGHKTTAPTKHGAKSSKKGKKDAKSKRTTSKKNHKARRRGAKSKNTKKGKSHKTATPDTAK